MLLLIIRLEVITTLKRNNKKLIWPIVIAVIVIIIAASGSVILYQTLLPRTATVNFDNMKGYSVNLTSGTYTKHVVDIPNNDYQTTMQITTGDTLHASVYQEGINNNQTIVNLSTMLTTADTTVTLFHNSNSGSPFTLTTS